MDGALEDDEYPSPEKEIEEDYLLFSDDFRDDGVDGFVDPLRGRCVDFYIELLFIYFIFHAFIDSLVFIDIFFWDVLYI